MSLAYIISAYRYAHQLVRLVDRLDDHASYASGKWLVCCNAYARYR